MKLLRGQRLLQFGTTAIPYELIYSERKTLAIHVYPDGSVVVDAPSGSALSSIEQKVQKRAAWIVRQQQRFATYTPQHPLPHRYVSGESFRYLGRQYRLKVREESVERVVLSSGFLVVGVRDVADKAKIAQLVDHWYRIHAQRIFKERLHVCYARVESLGVSYPDLAIRKMKIRWGSCSAAGRITLNINLICVTKEMIDYVILHELCHLKEHHHGAAFYALLDRVLPDWRERRERLNRAELT